MHLCCLFLFTPYRCVWIRSRKLRPERYLSSRVPKGDGGRLRRKSQAISAAARQESRVRAGLSAIFFEKDGKRSRMLHMRGSEERQDASCDQELKDFHVVISSVNC